MKEAVIIDACRSPIGRAGDRGVYRAISGRDLMRPVLRTIVERNKLDPGLIEDIVLGSAAGRWGGRNSGMLAGFPQSVAGTDCSRACASSTQAVAIAAHYIMNDDADIVIATGLETMDRDAPVQPWQVGRRGNPVGFRQGAQLTAEQQAAQYPPDWKSGADLVPPLPPGIPPWIGDMGRTAEELATRFNVPRKDMDEFSVGSHKKHAAAFANGMFKDEIIPITLKYTDGSSEIVDRDQCPRWDTTYEKIAALPPAYRENGVITAGNSCPRSDGAGAVLMMSKEKAKQLGYKPLMTFRHAVAVGVDPTVMGIGPVPSTQKLLARTGMKLSDFDIFEVNEAFACVVLYWVREMHATEKDIAKINPYGGSVAIGHPLGMTGTRQTAVIARHLNRTGGRFGLATLCVGGGQGMATLFEREDYK
jgi:acetyl-CoA acetyltransferase family protein